MYNYFFGPSTSTDPSDEEILQYYARWRQEQVNGWESGFSICSWIPEAVDEIEPNIRQMLIARYKAEHSSTIITTIISNLCSLFRSNSHNQHSTNTRSLPPQNEDGVTHVILPLPQSAYSMVNGVKKD